MTVTLVVAVASNGVIGRDGGLAWSRTGDLAHFKQLTWGHVLVMGRRTYDSIGRPLPGRTTVVVTRQPDWAAPADVRVTHDVPAALRTAAQLDPEVFVVGGGEVYRAALPLAHRLVLTHVHQSPEGDTWFPEVTPQMWREVAREAFAGFDIATYVRV